MVYAQFRVYYDGCAPWQNRSILLWLLFSPGFLRGALTTAKNGSISVCSSTGVQRWAAHTIKHTHTHTHTHTHVSTSLSIIILGNVEGIPLPSMQEHLCHYCAYYIQTAYAESLEHNMWYGIWDMFYKNIKAAQVVNIYTLRCYRCDIRLHRQSIILRYCM